jgi:hypothetical protein
MNIEQCSEMSAYKIQRPGNYPEESIQHSEHSESLKSRIKLDLHSMNPKQVNTSHKDQVRKILHTYRSSWYNTTYSA